MKHILKLMTVAALATLFAASCNKPNTDNNGTTAQKPVVTAEMFSVTANAETGDVVFKFTGSNGLTPFWTVTEPSGTKSSFQDREVTKNYKAKGTYNGTIIAFGAAGQSDPVEFSFVIGKTVPSDPTLSATENVLVSLKWKIIKYGYYGGEGEDYWDYYEGAPGCATDDRFEFVKGGAFKMDLGEDKRVYNDDEGLVEGIVVTGNEKWAYSKEGDKEYIKFSDGGFPGLLLGGETAINAKYLISEVTSESFTLSYSKSEDMVYVIKFVDEDYEAPVEGAVTEEAAKAALSGKTFKPAEIGWWGLGWEESELHYAVEDVAEMLVDDRITFGANGSLTINLGETPKIYNDCVAGGEEYTLPESPKWAIITEDGVVKVQFSEGGFPLVLAGDGEGPEDPNYHYGLNGKWTVRSIDEDGIVRLEIYQFWTEDQWLAIFLAPVTE